jgi:hypothetical protein
MVAGVNRGRRWPQPRRFRRVCCRRERRKSANWGWISPIPLARMRPSSSRSSGAERRGFGRPLAPARKLSGARVSVSCKNSRERERECRLGFSRRRRMAFYRRWRAAAFIGCVKEAVENRTSGRAPPSCLPAQGWRRPSESVSGWCWADLDFGQMGCGQVSAPLYFFLLVHFFLLPVFCFEL